MKNADVYMAAGVLAAIGVVLLVRRATTPATPAVPEYSPTSKPPETVLYTPTSTPAPVTHSAPTTAPMSIVPLQLPSDLAAVSNDPVTLRNILQVMDLQMNALNVRNDSSDTLVRATAFLGRQGTPVPASVLGFQNAVTYWAARKLNELTQQRFYG